MHPPSISPSRQPFANRTNFFSNGFVQLPTPPPTVKSKRHIDENPGASKRTKLCKDTCAVIEDVDVADDVDDVFMDCTLIRRRRSTSHGIMKAVAMGGGTSCLTALSTLPILQSFVSSHQSDVYKCHSIDSTAFLSPPYACAFTHDSKRGRGSILAVATEQGTVQIFNTTKRQNWDTEPPRTTVQVHRNGIFDVKWSSCDTILATASGDHTTRVTDFRTETMLYVLKGHSSTVKCVGWDPNHQELLATAGRDGCICLWDLRENSCKNRELSPVLRISLAHEPQAGKQTKKGKATSTARSVTSFVYLPYSPYEIVSSGSTDGILRKWDVRRLETNNSPRSKKSMALLNTPIDESQRDPTTMHNSRRARGISSLALGNGPTESMLFALSNDSKIHTYNPCGASGIPLEIDQGHGEHNTYAHEQMSTNSFYVKIGVSACGRWLASGSSNGSVFLFGVAARNGRPSAVLQPGIELKGQKGEVGALDWAEGQLATCADDGTVRIWRPDVEVQRQCIQDPVESRWGWSWAERT